MSAKKEKVAIISRSFWPENPAIGEALLLLAESLSQEAEPIVITQVAKGFSKKLRKFKRGKEVQFVTLPALTDSSSAMALRITELLLFTGFTLASLVYYRPDKVYVATNPPIFTPLVVRYYCQLFNKKYVYHLQDIHPEITSIVTGKDNVLTRLLELIDTKTITKASTVITLTEQMKSYIINRTGKQLAIELLPNPSVQDQTQPVHSAHERKKGFVYCGNAGRLQRIPLLIKSIKRYIQEDGKLPFVFAGGGVYSTALQDLADQSQNVTYLGVLTAREASKLLHNYSFGLMPIEDDVTKYAFPSKSSSYVFSGCEVVAICGKDTSVSDWVLHNNLGYVAEPNIEELVALFHDLEQEAPPKLAVSDRVFKELTPQYHANVLKKILMKKE